jgi:glycosyltransferase involved in cell wall biosynthesis
MSTSEPRNLGTSADSPQHDGPRYRGTEAPRNLKIAILGTRGVPPNYGGFETMAAELGTRLIARGHEVWVYSREDGPAVWNGIHRVVLPSLKGKYFETVSHSFVSALDAMRRGFDAVLVCNAANAFVLPLLRAARTGVAINVDGIERKRRKWNPLGRAVYTVGEAFSASFATVVADADVIADYYRAHYGVEAVTIPYGAEFPAEEDSDVLQRLGLEPRGYILYVSRFEPENNPLETVLAYEKLENAPPLVMLGKGLYAPELVAELQRHASERVRFPGALYGRDYRTLQRNALLYIQATEVGGTHPALIEAMASGGAVLANDTPENREVGGDAIGYFRFRPEETLSGTLSEWLGKPLMAGDFRERARRRAAEMYSWERVTDAYERLFQRLEPS